MDPYEFNQADKDARKSGYDIIGIYHSHPDHPPRPSNFDAERAWAGYSYFIIAVKNGKKETLISWVFDEAKKGFDEEEIKIGWGLLFVIASPPKADEAILLIIWVKIRQMKN